MKNLYFKYQSKNYYLWSYFNYNQNRLLLKRHSEKNSVLWYKLGILNPYLKKHTRFLFNRVFVISREDSFKASFNYIYTNKIRSRVFNMEHVKNTGTKNSSLCRNLETSVSIFNPKKENWLFIKNELPFLKLSPKKKHLDLNVSFFTNKNGLDLISQDIRSKPFLLGVSRETTEPIKFFGRSFDKGRLKKFVRWFVNKWGLKKTIKLLDTLKFLGFKYAKASGISLSLEDLYIPSHKESLVKIHQLQLLEQEFKVFQKTSEQTTYSIKFISTWTLINQLLRNAFLQYFMLRSSNHPESLISKNHKQMEPVKKPGFFSIPLHMPKMYISSSRKSKKDNHSSNFEHVSNQQVQILQKNTDQIKQNAKLQILSNASRETRKAYKTKNSEIFGSDSLYIMAFSGARGNMSQVSQLTLMRGLMSDPLGKLVEFPIISNFREGLNVTEYLISCYGARKGIIDTGLRTATAGDFTRRLVDVAHSVIIQTFDCGTKNGIYLKDLTLSKNKKTLFSLEQRLLGRVIANHSRISKDYRNKEISNNLLEKMHSGYPKIHKERQNNKRIEQNKKTNNVQISVNHLRPLKKIINRFSYRRLFNFYRHILDRPDFKNKNMKDIGFSKNEAFATIKNLSAFAIQAKIVDFKSTILPIFVSERNKNAAPPVVSLQVFFGTKKIKWTKRWGGKQKDNFPSKTKIESLLKVRTIIQNKNKKYPTLSEITLKNIANTICEFVAPLRILKKLHKKKIRQWLVNIHQIKENETVFTRWRGKKKTGETNEFYRRIPPRHRVPKLVWHQKKPSESQHLLSPLEINTRNEICVRSPLTCETLPTEYLCRKCYGWNALGRIIDVGEAVGVLAAQSLGEPGTQLTLRTFHTGGTYSENVGDFKLISPFDGHLIIPNYCSIKRYFNTKEKISTLITWQNLSYIKAKPINIIKKTNQFMNESIFAESKNIHERLQPFNRLQSMKIYNPRVLDPRNEFEDQANSLKDSHVIYSTKFNKQSFINRLNRVAQGAVFNPYAYRQGLNRSFPSDGSLLIDIIYRPTFQITPLVSLMYKTSRPVSTVPFLSSQKRNAAVFWNSQNTGASKRENNTNSIPKKYEKIHPSSDKINILSKIWPALSQRNKSRQIKMYTSLQNFSMEPVSTNKYLKENTFLVSPNSIPFKPTRFGALFVCRNKQIRHPCFRISKTGRLSKTHLRFGFNGLNQKCSLNADQHSVCWPPFLLKNDVSLHTKRWGERRWGIETGALKQKRVNSNISNLELNVTFDKFLDTCSSKSLARLHLKNLYFSYIQEKYYKALNSSTICNKNLLHSVNPLMSDSVRQSNYYWLRALHFAFRLSLSVRAEPRKINDWSNKKFSVNLPNFVLTNKYLKANAFFVSPDSIPFRDPSIKQAFFVDSNKQATQPFEPEANNRIFYLKTAAETEAKKQNKLYKKQRSTRISLSSWKPKIFFPSGIGAFTISKMAIDLDTSLKLQIKGGRSSQILFHDWYYKKSYFDYPVRFEPLNFKLSSVLKSKLFHRNTFLFGQKRSKKPVLPYKNFKRQVSPLKYPENNWLLMENRSLFSGQTMKFRVENPKFYENNSLTKVNIIKLKKDSQIMSLRFFMILAGSPKASFIYKSRNKRRGRIGQKRIKQIKNTGAKKTILSSSENRLQKNLYQNRHSVIWLRVPLKKMRPQIKNFEPINQKPYITKINMAWKNLTKASAFVVHNYKRRMRSLSLLKNDVSLHTKRWGKRWWGDGEFPLKWGPETKDANNETYSKSRINDFDNRFDHIFPNMWINDLPIKPMLISDAPIRPENLSVLTKSNYNSRFLTPKEKNFITKNYYLRQWSVDHSQSKGVSIVKCKEPISLFNFWWSNHMFNTLNNEISMDLDNKQGDLASQLDNYQAETCLLFQAPYNISLEYCLEQTYSVRGFFGGPSKQYPYGPEAGLKYGRVRLLDTPKGGGLYGRIKKNVAKQWGKRWWGSGWPSLKWELATKDAYNLVKPIKDKKLDLHMKIITHKPKIPILGTRLLNLFNRRATTKFKQEPVNDLNLLNHGYSRNSVLGLFRKSIIECHSKFKASFLQSLFIKYIQFDDPLKQNQVGFHPIASPHVVLPQRSIETILRWGKTHIFSPQGVNTVVKRQAESELNKINTSRIYKKKNFKWIGTIGSTIKKLGPIESNKADYEISLPTKISLLGREAFEDSKNSSAPHVPIINNRNASLLSKKVLSTYIEPRSKTWQIPLINFENALPFSINEIKSYPKIPKTSIENRHFNDVPKMWPSLNRVAGFSVKSIFLFSQYFSSNFYAFSSQLYITNLRVLNFKTGMITPSDFQSNNEIWPIPLNEIRRFFSGYSLNETNSQFINDDSYSIFPSISSFSTFPREFKSSRLRKPETFRNNNADIFKKIGQEKYGCYFDNENIYTPAFIKTKSHIGLEHDSKPTWTHKFTDKVVQSTLQTPVDVQFKDHPSKLFGPFAPNSEAKAVSYVYASLFKITRELSNLKEKSEIENFAVGSNSHQRNYQTVLTLMSEGKFKKNRIMVEIKKKPNILIKNKKDNFLFTIPIPLQKGIFSVDIPYFLAPASMGFSKKIPWIRHTFQQGEKCDAQFPTSSHTGQYVFNNQSNFDKFLFPDLNQEFLRNENSALPHLNEKNYFKRGLFNFNIISPNKIINSQCLLMGIHTENIFLPRFYGYKDNYSLYQKKSQMTRFDIFLQQYIMIDKMFINKVQQLFSGFQAFMFKDNIIGSKTKYSAFYPSLSQHGHGHDRVLSPQTCFNDQPNVLNTVTSRVPFKHKRSFYLKNQTKNAKIIYLKRFKPINKIFHQNSKTNNNQITKLQYKWNSIKRKFTYNRFFLRKPKNNIFNLIYEPFFFGEMLVSSAFLPNHLKPGKNVFLLKQFFNREANLTEKDKPLQTFLKLSPKISNLASQLDNYQAGTCHLFQAPPYASLQSSISGEKQDVSYPPGGKQNVSCLFQTYSVKSFLGGPSNQHPYGPKAGLKYGRVRLLDTLKGGDLYGRIYFVPGQNVAKQWGERWWGVSFNKFHYHPKNHIIIKSNESCVYDYIKHYWLQFIVAFKFLNQSKNSSLLKSIQSTVSRPVQEFALNRKVSLKNKRPYLFCGIIKTPYYKDVFKKLKRIVVPKNTKSFMKSMLMVGPRNCFRKHKANKERNNILQFAAFSLRKNSQYLPLYRLWFYEYDFFRKWYQIKPVILFQVFFVPKKTKCSKRWGKLKTFNKIQKQTINLRPLNSNQNIFFNSIQMQKKPLSLVLSSPCRNLLFQQLYGSKAGQKKIAAEMGDNNITAEQQICPNVLWYFFISAGSVFYYDFAQVSPNIIEKTSASINRSLVVNTERVGYFEERETIWNYKQSQIFLQSYINESTVYKRSFFVPSRSLYYMGQSNHFTWIKFYQILNRQGILKAFWDGNGYRCPDYSFYSQNTSLFHKFSSILQKSIQVPQIQHLGSINPIINQFPILKNRVISDCSVYTKTYHFISYVDRVQNIFFRMKTLKQNLKANQTWSSPACHFTSGSGLKRVLFGTNKTRYGNGLKGNLLLTKYCDKNTSLGDKMCETMGWDLEYFVHKKQRDSTRADIFYKRYKNYISSFLTKQFKLCRKPNRFYSFDRQIFSKSIKYSAINNIVFIPRITQFYFGFKNHFLFKIALATGYHLENNFLRKALKFYAFRLPIDNWKPKKHAFGGKQNVPSGGVKLNMLKRRLLKIPKSFIYKNSLIGRWQRGTRLLNSFKRRTTTEFNRRLIRNRKITKPSNLTHYFNNVDLLSKTSKISDLSFQPVSYKLFSTEQLVKYSSIKTFDRPKYFVGGKYYFPSYAWSTGLTNVLDYQNLWPSKFNKYQSLCSIQKKPSESLINSSTIFGEFFKNSDTIQLGIQEIQTKSYEHSYSIKKSIPFPIIKSWSNQELSRGKKLVPYKNFEKIIPKTGLAFYLFSEKQNIQASQLDNYQAGTRLLFSQGILCLLHKQKTRPRFYCPPQDYLAAQTKDADYEFSFRDTVREAFVSTKDKVFHNRGDKPFISVGPRLGIYPLGTRWQGKTYPFNSFVSPDSEITKHSCGPETSEKHERGRLFTARLLPRRLLKQESFNSEKKKSINQDFFATKILAANYSYSISLDRTYNLLLRYLHEIKRSMTLSSFIESKIRIYSPLSSNSKENIRPISWFHLINFDSKATLNNGLVVPESDETNFFKWRPKTTNIFISKQNIQENRLLEFNKLKFVREGSDSTCLISEFYLEPLLLKNIKLSNTCLNSSNQHILFEQAGWLPLKESLETKDAKGLSLTTDERQTSTCYKSFFEKDTIKVTSMGFNNLFENVFSQKWYISIYNFNYFWHFISLKFDIVIAKNLNHFRNARYKHSPFIITKRERGHVYNKSGRGRDEKARMLNEPITNHKKEITHYGYELNKPNYKYSTFHQKSGITVPFFKRLLNLNANQTKYFKLQKKSSSFAYGLNNISQLNQKIYVGVQSLLQKTVNLHSSYFDAFQINTFNQIYFINAVASLSNASKSSDITQGVPLLKRYFDLPKDSPIHLLLKQTFEKYYSYSNISYEHNSFNKNSILILKNSWDNKKSQKKIFSIFDGSPIINNKPLFLRSLFLTSDEKQTLSSSFQNLPANLKHIKSQESWSKVKADYELKTDDSLKPNRQFLTHNHEEKPFISVGPRLNTLVPESDKTNKHSCEPEADKKHERGRLFTARLLPEPLLNKQVPKRIIPKQTQKQAFSELFNINGFKNFYNKFEKNTLYRHKPKVNLEECLKLRTIALKYSLIKILQKIVNNVQAVYRGQGVEIYDQHIEVLVSQMGFSC